MKHNYFYFSFALFLSACASDEQVDSLLENNIVSNLSGVVMNIPDFVFDESATRTNLVPTSSSVEFSWKEGDQVGIYTESTSMANFDIDQISQDAKSATFNGGGFSLTEGSTYYAFYPYDAASTEKTWVSINYFNQVQIADNDCTHLSNYDYMSANAEAGSNNNALFEFAHLGAIVKIKVNLPKNGTFTKMIIHGNSTFNNTGHVNLVDKTTTKGIDSNTLQLGLDNVSSTNCLLTLYMMVSPCLYTDGKKLIVELIEDTGDVYYGFITAKKMVEGKAYGYSVSVSKVNQEHDAVDLGLTSGTLWATCNIGAYSPEDHGYFYQWGETEIEDIYILDNYNFYKNGKLTKYNFDKDYGTVDSKNILDSEDDVAHVLWGDNWRMPTRADFNELITECDLQVYTLNGVHGFLFTSKTNGNTLFLPAAGGYYNSNNTVGGYSGSGQFGYYWTSSLYPKAGLEASYCAFNYYSVSIQLDRSQRRCGNSVRPVKVD